MSSPYVIEWVSSLFLPTLVIVTITMVVVIIKKFQRKEKQNEINEISLLGKKIEIDNSQKSIDQLTGDSNAEHGVVSSVEQSIAGSSDKKK